MVWDVLHDPLKDGIAIVESHHQHLPLHCSPGGTDAGQVAVGLLEGHLVVSILHVQDGPYLESALSLKDFTNPGKWVCVSDGGIIEAPEVHHKPVFTRLFLGDWEGWAAPWPLARFNLTVMV